MEASSVMFTSHPSLPTNEELPFLPPLPATPQHAYKSYLSEEYLLRAKTPITKKLWEERLSLDSPSDHSSSTKERETKKWDVDIEYPILTTRQNVFSTPALINRIPSRDLSRGSRTPSGSSIKTKDQTPSPASISQQADERQSLPQKPHETTTVAQQSFSLPTKDEEIPRNIHQSPHKSHISTQHLSPIKAQEPAQPRLSASFNLPTYVADASLLADQSLMGGATSSADEDSFHLDLKRLRPQRAVSEEQEEKEGLDQSESSKSSGSDTPTKPYTTKSSYLAPPQNPLDQSTLLPRSPARLAHLLEAKNAINNVEAPWTGDDSLLYESSISSRENSVSPEKPSSSSHSANFLPKTQTMTGFPTSSSSHSIVSLPKIKRTFPASSSAQSLSSLGEEGEYAFGGEGEISTLLPVSPMKTAHLLSDAELIAKETLDEEASFRIPLPSKATNTPFKPSLMAKTPKKSPPARISPIKTIVRGTLHRTPSDSTAVQEEGDITFDVKDLLAKVNKPKRPSGTEESFVDLLHDNLMPDDLDASMMGPDECMLPPSYRSGSYRGTSISPIKNTLAVTPLRASRTVNLSSTTERDPSTDLPSTVRRLPISHTTHNLASQAEGSSEETKQATISRSKSLSRVAEIIQRVKSERATAQQSHNAEHHGDAGENEQEEVLAAMSPPKTAIRTRTYTTTSRTPTTSSSTITTTTTRPRNSMMPPPPSSRRISLSAGAIPFGSSASVKTIDLPSAGSSTVRSANTASALAGRRTVATRPSISTTAGSSVAAPTSTRPPVATRSAGSSMAPPIARVQPRARMGSNSSTVSLSASVPTLSTARTTTSSRLTSRPSTAAPVSRISTTTTAGATRPVGGVAATSTRISRPSTVARAAGLPKPGDGPSARSTIPPVSAGTASSESRTKLSRGFGTDASSTTNRVPRPSIATTTSRTSSKLSTGPSITTSKIETQKSRSLSTPASSLASSSSTGTSRIPPVPSLPTSSRITKPRETTMKKSSMPPPSSAVTSTGGITQKSRIGTSNSAALTSRDRQGLPKPPSSFRPTNLSRSSAPPSTSAGGTGPGLSALRERLDRLHARQVR